MAMTETDPDFDTLAYTRKLREAGVEERQAEAHADAARTIRAGLATKADLDNLETRFDTRFDALEMRFEARIAGLRADIYGALWIQGAGLIAVMVALAGVIVAAVKLL